MAELGRPSSTSSSNTPPSPSWSCLSSSLSRAFLSFRWYLGLKAYFPSRTSILGLLDNAWREGEVRFTISVWMRLLPLKRNIHSVLLHGSKEHMILIGQSWYSVVKKCVMHSFVMKNKNVPTTQVIKVQPNYKAYFCKFCNQCTSSCYFRKHESIPHYKAKQSNK